MTQAPPARPRHDPLPTRETLGRTPGAAAKPARLVSLDAYRGLIMILLASSAFGLSRVAANKQFADDPAWKAVAFQTDHVDWAGGTLLNLLRHDEASEKANRLGDWFGGGAWDLIQPSFMFMAGVAIPYSFASRRARGDSMLRVWLHVFLRAFLLIALGIFLRSTGSPRTNFTFEDVITQIGLGYPIVFLVFLLGYKFGNWPLVYLTALVAILAGYWAYFYFWPLPPADFDFGEVGLASGPWPWASGLFAHWDKNTNAAQWFDREFLNYFSRKAPWKYNGGGYLTLNFVPSMATAIFGLVAGDLLRGSWTKGAKLLTLLVLSAACLGVGAYAGDTICPIVKRIWTPSWAVYSAGWTFLLLAVCFAIFDCIGLRWLAFPLVVVGMNSIAVYCMESLIRGWVASMLQIHLNTPVHRFIEWINASRPEESQVTIHEQWYTFAGVYSPIVQAGSVLLVIWLICFWMYRRRIFLRI
jgi:heparan-alpha-glucosaminide N-acetyltransferase